MSATIDQATDLDHLLATAVQDDKEAGVFRCRRDIFTNAELYELEMKHIFESNWVYLRARKPDPGQQRLLHDVDRPPADRDHARQDRRAARGDQCLCPQGRDAVPPQARQQGQLYVPFHGWTFSNTGKLLKVKDEKTTEYPVQFNTNGSHDLKKVARFANYRGFLFGSLSADVLPLEDYLGEARVIIDQIVDRRRTAEVLRGNSSYIYEGNWKMQMENGCDGYHVSTVHWNYAATMGRRKEDGTKAVDANSWSKSVAGVYGFDNGHILLWTQTMNPEVRPVYQHRDEIKARVGDVQADFIVNQTRNLCVPERVPDGPVQHADPRGAAARRRQDRSHDLLLRAEGRERGRPHDPDPPVRGFLQRDGHGHRRRSRGIPRMQAGYAGITAMWNDLSRGAPLWIDSPTRTRGRWG